MRTSLPPLILSRLDLGRLEELLEHPSSARIDTEALRAELERAEIRESAEMPTDVITMNSVTCFVDETTGAEREVALVYPRDADGGRGKLSILSPIGTALLGTKFGDSISWQVPSGRRA